jgi:hypothetical protein
LPADHKVNVAWQIVATFIIIANFWAFYRIRKLRKYLLYIFVPSIVATIIVTSFFYNIGITSTRIGSTIGTFDFVSSDWWAYVLLNILGFTLQGLAIYLVVRWSREHNQRFKAKPELPK